MKPSKMLPANEAVLKKRFADAYIKIMETANRMPASFYYVDTPKGAKLKMAHGEYEYSPYGSNNPKKLIERWFANLNRIRITLLTIGIW